MVGVIFFFLRKCDNLWCVYGVKCIVLVNFVKNNNNNKKKDERDSLWSIIWCIVVFSNLGSERMCILF